MDTNQKKNDPHAGFYSRLAKLIRESPHTQKEICSQTDISPSGLAKYKKNRVPKADELFKLARFFGVRMEWLLKEEGLRGAAEAMDKSDLFFGKERSAPELRAAEEAVTDREVKRRDEECAPKLKDDEGEYEADRIVTMRQMEEENYSLEKELIAAQRELGESRRIIEKLVSTLDFSDKTRFKSLPEMTIRDLEGRDDYPNGHQSEKK